MDKRIIMGRPEGQLSTSLWRKSFYISTRHVINKADKDRGWLIEWGRFIVLELAFDSEKGYGWQGYSRIGHCLLLFFSRVKSVKLTRTLEANYWLDSELKQFYVCSGDCMVGDRFNAGSVYIELCMTWLFERCFECIGVPVVHMESRTIVLCLESSRGQRSICTCYHRPRTLHFKYTAYVPSAEIAKYVDIQVCFNPATVALAQVCKLYVN